MADRAPDSQQKCPACGATIDAPEAEPLARVPCPACGESVRIERAFDHFLIVETLGVGGMGSVYKARDTRLERFVALKLLRKELSADPVEAARLEQEARVTAAINHPNVVQVYSSGNAHGQIYLVIELVDHGSLDDLMAQHPRVPEASVLEAGLQVAKGLQAAHAKGLIHRDVKPANILFSDAHTAKIGDFGLAVVAEQKAETQNEIWGTPYYVAPERLNNEPEDFRRDIFSLGATLFHALAGRPPIEGETTSASQLRELKNNPPDLRAVVPEVSRETASVVRQMLAPNPADRFASYDELIAALQRAAQPDGGATAGASKSRRPWVIAAGVAVAALIGAGVFFSRQKSATPVPEIAPIATPSPSATPDNSAALRHEEETRKRAEARAKKKLAAETASREAAANEARAAERQKLLEAETPGWEKALAEVHARVATYDFPAALAALDRVHLSEPSLVEAQSNERKKIRWLTEWKNKLKGDIRSGHFTAPIEIGGVKYTGASKADDTRITFRLPPYGTADIAWVKIPAPGLFNMSISLITPAMPDAADRQWFAAVFAAETGQTAAARPLAEAAAEAKPEYAEALKFLFSE